MGPQGQPNSTTSSTAVHIDEAPPVVSFEPQQPGDPTGVVVNATDSESGVAGGSVQIAPVGSGSWAAAPTSYDGAHLLAHLDDAGLHGPYAVRATACDNVGNCATTSETLTMPLRLPAASDVGFAKIGTPAKVVREQVLVGFRYKRERRRRQVRQGEDRRALPHHPNRHPGEHPVRAKARQDGTPPVAGDDRVPSARLARHHNQAGPVWQAIHDAWSARHDPRRAHRQRPRRHPHRAGATDSGSSRRPRRRRLRRAVHGQPSCRRGPHGSSAPSIADRPPSFPPLDKPP